MKCLTHILESQPQTPNSHILEPNRLGDTQTQLYIYPPTQLRSHLLVTKLHAPLVSPICSGSLVVVLIVLIKLRSRLHHTS